MLWKILVALATFLGLHHHDSPVHFVPTETGPQSPAEEADARQALQGDFENGDMIFSEDFPTSAGIKDTKYRWPGYPGAGNVPYVISPALASIKPKILESMEQYHNLTCIKFVPRTNEKDFIYLIKGNRGCASYVGKVKKGAQEVYLGSGCEYVGTIVHELGHAIGLFHEHQRSDRDTYITVYDKNVRAGQGHNFKKTSKSEELIFTDYEYSSIMHYGNYAFSKKPKQLKTMEAKNGEKLLEPYDKPGLTDSDVTMVKKLYKCE